MTETVPRLIEVRKLAAVDMVWLGPKVVIAEYALGIVLPLALGLRSVWMEFAGAPRSSVWPLALGLWLITIAANYVPLFLHAVSLRRGNAVEREGRPELARARRYGVQQVMILVPFLVLVLAVFQLRTRRPADGARA
jgi:hypothetical protein